MHFPRNLRRTLLATLLLGSIALPASASTILFVGNSFTYGDPAGAQPPTVQAYRPGTVTDLNGSNIGGVPALFKAMTLQAGLNYDVSLETRGGSGLDYHYNSKYSTIVKPFDTVVLQSYSTLDASRPGDPATLIRYSGLLADALYAQNPNVDVRLTATWSRADLTYRNTSSPWYGDPIYAMALDVRAGYDAADAASDHINGVIPVGEAWNRAIAGGLADANPYDGIGAGQINLWAPDSYHGSVYGYYLEALTIFGSVTGLDPRSLGGNEYSARELGIDVNTALALQAFAAAQLDAEEVPEPGMAALFATLGGLMFAARRRARAGVRA
ncbi:PEP-CTERM sorting domain-containing protein [Massilia sp. Leaf139]|uniref:PEP-CTERM sorting domain-containing protein n=1 Tax=Massilia sp. Leaf139 TaxID=1736272 RepID=UPI00070083CB|nr:PEP-CTERM sorting domain-containing protein [Massilia sp. Leaf139]KQQ93562.1 glycosyl transferase family 1 [Massilia sp. Leaf139]